MKNFLFLNLKNPISSRELSLIKDYNEIHINLLILERNNQDVSILIEELKKYVNKTISVYSSRIENIIFLEKQHITVHYCWVNNEYLSDDFLMLVNKNQKNEFFWIINDDILKYEKEILLNNLKKLKRPICIYFTKTLIDKEVQNYKKLKSFISWIQKNWINTLFEIEKDLYVENSQDQNYLSWEDNIYYDNQENIRKNLVMGVYGDVSVNISEENKKINLLNLRKNKECLSCEYFTFCRERGIGLIMNEINLHECVSVKFLKNNT